MYEFVEGIRDYARKDAPVEIRNPDYLVIAQNASDLHQYKPGWYEEIIDGIALEAIWWDGFNTNAFDDWDVPGGYNEWTSDEYSNYTHEVLTWLEPLKGVMPIFCCEYAQDVDGSNEATWVYEELARTNGFIPYCTRRSLEKLSTTPYPAGYWPHDY